MLIHGGGPPPISEIIPGCLYSGNIEGAGQTEELQRRNVTHIVSLIPGSSPADSKVFQILQFDIEDLPGVHILNLFDKSVEFIDSACRNGKAAFVHCSAGVSRSGAFVIAYVMWREKLPLRKAWEFVRSKRKWTNPNFGFTNQLAQWELKLFGHERKDDETLRTAPPPTDADSSAQGHVNGASQQELDRLIVTDGQKFLVEQIRQIWPQQTVDKSDEQVALALRNGHFNHVEVLFCLLHNVQTPIVH